MIKGVLLILLALIALGLISGPGFRRFTESVIHSFTSSIAIRRREMEKFTELIGSGSVRSVGRKGRALQLSIT